MSIEIVGTGYVGLVTGAVFADFGHKVQCLDVDSKKINSLKKGEIPFYEPGLEELVRINSSKNRLTFTESFADSIPKCKTIFICVGTPPGKNGEADLSYLFSSVKSTAKYLSDNSLIVIKSTVPIGVEEELESIVAKNTKARFEIASCPEFLREGSAVEDCRNPDRIVIGTKSKEAADRLLDLYKNFGGERLVCDIRSAQMIKYASNSLLATKISYANAIANLCEKTGADAELVLQGVGLDRRIGRSFLYPGLGFGGSCFPKDISAFIDIASRINYDFGLLKEVEKINKGQIELFLDKVADGVGDLKDKHLAVFGLSFKPNTDDMREAPSVKIINRLLEKGANVNAYDPVALRLAQMIFKDSINYHQDPYKAAQGADAVLVVTEWNEFKELDLVRLKNIMKNPVIIDGRNIYDPQKIRSLGFKYSSIGRQ